MNSASDSVWSAPDSDGVITCNLDVGAVSTLRGRRKRKGVNCRTTDVALWPSSWRDILKDWVKKEYLSCPESFQFVIHTMR